MKQNFRLWLCSFSVFLILVGAPTLLFAQGPSDPSQERAKLFEQTQKHLRRGKKKSALKTLKRYIGLGAQPNVNDLYNGFYNSSSSQVSQNASRQPRRGCVEGLQCVLW